MNDQQSLAPVEIKINKDELEQAFSLGCTVKEVAALLGLRVEALDMYCYAEYAQDAAETQKYFAARGIARLRMHITQNLLNGDIDYHRIYGKAFFEATLRPAIDHSVKTQFTIEDADQIEEYVLEIPSNGRDSSQEEPS